MRPASEVVKPYFDLSQEQFQQLDLLQHFVADWNSKINLISRKDTDNIMEHHILHSLSIAKYTKINQKGTRVLDLGTGGGFPGLPLAILWPNTQFHLIDARRKKIDVVRDLIDQLSLSNCSCAHRRVEEEPKGSFDFAVSRAVASLDKLITWSQPLVHDSHRNALPNGLICLKGGDINGEIRPLLKKHYIDSEAINAYFKLPYFEEKYVVYVQMA